MASGIGLNSGCATFTHPSYFYVRDVPEVEVAQILERLEAAGYREIHRFGDRRVFTSYPEEKMEKARQRYGATLFVAPAVELVTVSSETGLDVRVSYGVYHVERDKLTLSYKGVPVEVQALFAPFEEPEELDESVD